MYVKLLMNDGETDERVGVEGVEVCPGRDHTVLEFPDHDEELVGVDRIYIGD